MASSADLHCLSLLAEYLHASWSPNFYGFSYLFHCVDNCILAIMPKLSQKMEKENSDKDTIVYRCKFYVLKGSLAE